ncbi:DUF4913 domain-containing protein [Nocardia asiatica]|uniref:DUF4913 domain-containing protein n=1 Tax=Nocardia asiatica TaxID=209252 RepID=UPI00031757BA|nr:DUF4913 domain-containing protein [Nocardia asiatica]
MNFDPSEGFQSYPSLGMFLRDFLTNVYRREVNDNPECVWCPEPWKHPEAMVRLTVIWRTYELLLHTRGEEGVSAWMLDHADPHMAKLFAYDGPFKCCNPRKGHTERLNPLPTAPIPDELFANGIPEELLTGSPAHQVATTAA